MAEILYTSSNSHVLQDQGNIVYAHGLGVTVETDPIAQDVLRRVPGATVPHLVDEHVGSEGNFAIQPSIAERAERLGHAIDIAIDQSGQKADLILHSEGGAIFEQLLRTRNGLVGSLGQVSFLAIPLVYDKKRLKLFSKPATEEEERVGLEYGGVEGSYRRGRVPLLLANEYRQEVAARDGNMHDRYDEMFGLLHEGGVSTVGLAAEKDRFAGWNQGNLDLVSRAMEVSGLRMFELKDAEHDFKQHARIAAKFALEAPRILKAEMSDSVRTRLSIYGIREMSLSAIRETVSI